MEFIVPLLYSEVVSKSEATSETLAKLVRQMGWREVITRAIGIANLVARELHTVVDCTLRKDTDHIGMTTGGNAFV
jgi:hypothetical protein